MTVLKQKVKHVLDMFCAVRKRSHAKNTKVKDTFLKRGSNKTIQRLWNMIMRII